LRYLSVAASGRIMQEGRSMAARRKVEFYKQRRFDKDVENLGPSNSPVVLTDLIAFQIAWNQVDGDIPERFHYEEYKGVKGSDTVFQVYVGPKRKFRAAAILFDNRDEAHWIHAFKKEAKREPEHVKLAISRAKALITKLRRR
jgi:hypothetical protein